MHARTAHTVCTKKAFSRAPFRREPKKTMPFPCTYTHFCKENDTTQPNTDRLQTMPWAKRTLPWPIARRAWQYSKPLLDVQVGNRQENTFAL